jgi:RHS repeat-associated protein
MENLCNDRPPAKSNVFHPAAPLTISAQRLSRMTLDDPPTIMAGDVMVFEANRRDFILRTEVSNRKEIVVGPLTLEEAEDTSVAWRKGIMKLDYPEVLGQKIVGYSVKVLHETGAPLLFRGVKIYRKGEMMLELEPASPTPKRNPTPHVEPPFRYPSDPVLVASLRQPPLSLPGLGSASTGFVRTTLPPVQPIMLQSTATTASTDPNHFKWNGKEFDTESGLLNFGARYYSPALGRFMTPDPKIMSAQRMFDPQQWNMYSYGRNNPTTFIDPDGKELQYANAADKKALHNVLVNIARRPGGLSMLKTLSDSKAVFTLHKTEKGELGGVGHYGLTDPRGATYDKATGKDLQGTSTPKRFPRATSRQRAMSLRTAYD